MTRKEAIENMRKLSFVWEIGKQTLTQKQIDETLEMAIKALEQETCEDYISRQAVLQVVSKGCQEWRGIYDRCEEFINALPSVKPQEPKTGWIPVSERLPETDNENTINNYNVLLWVKDKTHPKEEPQIYLGKLRHIDGDDGSGNFWGVETKPCEWTIWGWSYFFEPEVIAWMPLPKSYKESEVKE